MSKYLKNCKQFLLSHQVSYQELKDYQIKGANGCLSDIYNKGIVIPRSKTVNTYFNQGHSYPNISDFGAIIALHNWNESDLKQINATLCYPEKDHYLGFMTDKNDETLNIKLEIYRTLLDRLNTITQKKHKIVHETIQNGEKQLYLIKRKK